MNGTEQFDDDLDAAQYLLNILIERATGGFSHSADYLPLRKRFLESRHARFLPRWIKSCRTLDQFWHFIQPRFRHYAERREFLWEQFNPLIEHLESGSESPLELSFNDLLEEMDETALMDAWARCTERVAHDPAGAITAARTMLETTLKHVVDDLDIDIGQRNPDLPALYAMVAAELNMSPKDHADKTIKMILSGCNSIVSGLGELRNAAGDAHGRGRRATAMQDRHARLAVNAAGTLSLFIIQTVKHHTG